MKQEMLKLTLLIISMVIMTGYTLYVYLRYNNLKSISQSYYKLPSGKKWMFSFALWGGVVPLLGFCVYPFNWLLFVAICLICLVPVLAHYRVDSIVVVHIVCATGGIVLAMIYLLTIHQWWYVAGYAGIIVMILLQKGKSNVLWIEYFGYLYTALGLLVSIYY